MDFDFYAGKKPYIFFLHGWGCDKSSLSFFKNYFDNGMVFVSFAGFGKTPAPSVPYFVDDYANELFCLKQKIAKDDQIIIICHSFGARVAAKYISKHPNDVCKLVIIDGAGLKPKRTKEYYKKVKEYKKVKRLVSQGKADSKLLGSYGSQDYKALDPVMRQTFINIVNEDLSKDFKKIKCITLLVWGSEDKETPLYMAKKLEKIIKPASLIVIRGAGHFCWLDSFAQFITLLSAFV